MGKIIILGDLHFPYHHKPALTEVLEVIKKNSSDISHIVQIGDLFDFFSLSRFPRSHDYATPLDEVTLARACAEEMWSVIKKYAPKAKCYQLMGNHDVRLKRRVKEKLPELLNIVSLDHLFKFDGVTTIFDEREELVIGNVCFMHGFYSKMGQHCRENMMNTVWGHTHRGSVFFSQVRNNPFWELNVGLLADPHSKVMNYIRQRWVQWTIGYGLIDEHGPRFIPIPLRKKARKSEKIISLCELRKKKKRVFPWM